MIRLVSTAAGKLSRLRRRRWAGVAVVLVALGLTGGAYTAFSPASADETQSNAELIAEGRELYLVGCASCHGLNGEGIDTTEEGRIVGPTLVGVGAAAAHFQVGTGRMPMAQTGQQAPRKPVTYTEEEILALSAFVGSLGPGPAIPAPGDYSLDGLSEEEREEATVRGGQIFLTNCTACHNFQGAGGAMPKGGYAPKIRGVEPIHIYEAMLTGPQTMDSFSNGNLSPEDKRDVIAYLMSIQEPKSSGGFGMGGLGPVAEGLFAWLFLGLLVGFAVWIAAHSTRTTKEKVSE
jgi:ubiquinol-cytochrome c reductase cytochrome c subunit